MNFLFKNATIVFCEGKYFPYKYSNFIAEFFNSFSGLFLSCVPIIFIINYPVNILLKKSLFITFLLGLGTFAFHSTQLYLFQITDELPMLLLCFEFFDIMYQETNNFYIIPIIIFSLGYINDLLQVITLQLTILFFIIILVYKMYFFKFQKEFNIICIIGIIACIVWLIDDCTKYINGHAYWHILMSIFLYYAFVCMNKMLERLQYTII